MISRRKFLYSHYLIVVNYERPLLLMTPYELRNTIVGCYIYEAVRRSLRVMVTFAAIRLRGLRFKPRTGQTFETRVLLHAHPMLRLWDHNLGYQSQSQAWKLTISKYRADRMGADTSVVKKKHE